MFLDDLLKNKDGKAIRYATLPTELYLSADLCGLLEAMEVEANAGGNPTEREAGTLIGFTSNDGKLDALPTVLSDGGAFDPKVFLTGGNGDFSKVALGFKYVGTVHTHPRRAADDPLNCFSGSDVLSFAEQTFHERISLMVTGQTVHLLVDTDDDLDVDAVQMLGTMITQSMNLARDDVVVVQEKDLPELMKSPQAVPAVMKAATTMLLGYYVGQLGDRLLKLS